MPLHHKILSIVQNDQVMQNEENRRIFMTELYYGRGSQNQFDEYIDFINYVFGFNGAE